MSLAENLSQDLANEGEKNARTKTCRLGDIITHMEHDDRAAVMAAVGDLRYSLGTLAKVLAKNGIEVSESSLRNHRLNKCKWCRVEGYEF